MSNGREDAMDQAMAGQPAVFRAGNAHDSSSLAILADAATRRLISWLWDQSADEGQSSFEVGRQIISSDASSSSHHSQWRVGERHGRVGAGLNSYVLTAAHTATPQGGVADVLAPTLELKTVALGTWYVSVCSVFPEFRGQGLGQQVLAEADRLATAAGIAHVTLLVGSFNTGAHRLYTRLGFEEWERRPFVQFPGSDGPGDWILMRRPVSSD